MTSAALEIPANKHNSRVKRTKALLNPPFDFVLPLPSSLPSVTCLLSTVLFPSQMSHVFLSFFSFLFFFTQLVHKTVVSFSFSLCLSPSLSLPLSSPFSFFFFFPRRRLAQSLLRVRKQTQIILGALLACDRGLASRF